MTRQPTQPTTPGPPPPRRGRSPGRLVDGFLEIVLWLVLASSLVLALLGTFAPDWSYRLTSTNIANDADRIHHEMAVQASWICAAVSAAGLLVAHRLDRDSDRP
jgi:hypothetical protein